MIEKLTSSLDRDPQWRIRNDAVTSIINCAPQSVLDNIALFTENIFVKHPEPILTIAFIKEGLRALDRKDELEGQMSIRGHHTESRNFLLQLGMERGFIPRAHKSLWGRWRLNQPFIQFCNEGLPNSETERKNILVYKSIAEDHMAYMELLLRISPDYDYYPPEGPIRYNYDSFGTTAEEKLAWLLKNSLDALRLYRLPGETPVFYSVYPDERCGACAHGRHCFVFSKQESDGTWVDPKDILYLTRYWEKGKFLPDAHGQVQKPQILKSRMQTQNQKEINQPLIIRTNLRDFRFNAMMLALPNAA